MGSIEQAGKRFAPGADLLFAAYKQRYLGQEHPS